MKMKEKLKIKSLAMWLVIGVLGLVAVTGVVKASSDEFSWARVEDKVAQILAETAKSLDGFLGASGTRFPNGLSTDSTSPVAGQVRGSTLTITGAASTGALTVSSITASGQLNALGSYEEMTAVATNTLTVAESGKTIYLATSTPQILPSTSTSAGVYFRFVVSSALTGTSTITTSDGGNDIEGVVDVNSTMVDCDAEDTITVGGAFENVGDWIELYSNGSKWFVRGNALTAGQFACSAT